jgi:hypothetical protein
MSLGGDLDYAAQKQEALEQGRAVEPRTGRPPMLDAAALAFLSKALEAGPQAYGLRVTIWTIRDLRDERPTALPCESVPRQCTAQCSGWATASARPRHALRHRQVAEAVAGAKYVLTELQKRG